MIIMNMNAPKGNLEYKSRTEYIDGKEWIILSLKPAVNKTKTSGNLSLHLSRKFIWKMTRRQAR